MLLEYDSPLRVYKGQWSDVEDCAIGSCYEGNSVQTNRAGCNYLLEARVFCERMRDSRLNDHKLGIANTDLTVEETVLETLSVSLS